MKQNSIKILKNRFLNLKTKKTSFLFILKKSFNSNSNISLKKKKFHFFYNFFNYKHNLKKICNSNGKFTSINKKLKISRTSINSFLIENTLSFYKK